MANILGTATPAATFSEASPIAFLTAFKSSSGGSLTHFRWYSVAGFTATAARVRVWDTTASTTALVDQSVTLGTTTGWAAYAFSSPVTLVAGRDYVISLIWDTGTVGYPALTSAPFPLVNGVLSASAASFRSGTGVDLYSMPSGTTSYYLDVEVAVSSPLAVSAGSAQSIYTSQAASIAATATGGSGTKTYAWTKTSGPAGTFSAASSASGTFTPTGGVGTYVLRCTVTDASGTAYSEVTITVTAVPVTTSYSSITSSTGWTATGGTVQAVLADASDATYVISPSNPTAAILDGTLGAVSAPSAGQDFVVTVKAQKIDATSGSLVARLYDGATLASTVTLPALPDDLADVTITFPSGEVATVSPATWAIGVRLTLSVTAA